MKFPRTTATIGPPGSEQALKPDLERHRIIVRLGQPPGNARFGCHINAAQREETDIRHQPPGIAKRDFPTRDELHAKFALLGPGALDLPCSDQARWLELVLRSRSIS